MKTQSELENLSNPRVNDTISLIKNSGLFRSDHHNILINEIINFNNNVIKTILDTSLQPSKRVIKINEYKDGIIRLLTGDFLIPGKTVSHPGGINGLITDSINKITDDTTKELEEDAGIELGQGKTIIPMECIFAKVGGGSSKDVIHCRDQPNKSAKSLGLLKKKNCPDNKTFIVDANRGSGDYRALLNPSKYGIKVKKGTVVYVNIKDKDIKTTDVTHVIDFDPVAVRRGRSIIFDKVDRDGYPSEITGKLKSSKGNEGTTKGRKIKDTNTRTDILPNIGDIGTYQNEPVLDRLKKNKNYFNNYTDKDIDDHKTISENLNIIANNEENNIKKAMMELFNRYRLSYPSNQLSKSFGHVFFTRPSLNIYDNFEGGILNKQANSDATFYFLNQVNQSVLKSLCSEFDNSHRFFPFLSNMAQTFEVSDEVINTAEQGETLTGHKIKIARHNIASKTAGSFNIQYIDDDEYRIYKIHKAWTDYMSKVYRGEMKPKSDYIDSRILDYAVSVYYFLCAPDGETILFWSKYTGVFPTNTPSSVSSWSRGNIVKIPEFNISYDYAWKADFDPVHLYEFNTLSGREDADSTYTYLRQYEKELGTTGRNFTGAPFIETVEVNSDRGEVKYVYKLKFGTYNDEGVTNIIGGDLFD